MSAITDETIQRVLDCESAYDTVFAALEPDEYLARSVTLPCGTNVRIRVGYREHYRTWAYTVTDNNPPPTEDDCDPFDRSSGHIGSGEGYATVEDAVRALAVWATMRNLSIGGAG